MEEEGEESDRKRGRTKDRGDGVNWKKEVKRKGEGEINSCPYSEASLIKMQSKAGINMEPWGTPLVRIKTSNSLSELCYLLHCTVYTIVIPVGDRNTANLPPRSHLHHGSFKIVLIPIFRIFIAHR